MKIKYQGLVERPARKGSRIIWRIELKNNVVTTVTDEQYKKMKAIPMYKKLVDAGVITEYPDKKPTRSRSTKKPASVKEEPDPITETVEES